MMLEEERAGTALTHFGSTFCSLAAAFSSLDSPFASSTSFLLSDATFEDPAPPSFDSSKTASFFADDFGAGSDSSTHFTKQSLLQTKCTSTMTCSSKDLLRDTSSVDSKLIKYSSGVENIDDVPKSWSNGKVKSVASLTAVLSKCCRRSKHRCRTTDRWASPSLILFRKVFEEWSSILLGTSILASLVKKSKSVMQTLARDIGFLHTDARMRIKDPNPGSWST
mmetsp:Transcript_6934/g.16992  ORF Transcript_6934/g.16992 Transcript_6934/m.16992 type:complete len:223 (-) Transcript_6934:285-953(-)